MTLNCKLINLHLDAMVQSTTHRCLFPAQGTVVFSTDETHGEVQHICAILGYLHPS